MHDNWSSSIANGRDDISCARVPPGAASLSWMQLPRGAFAADPPTNESTDASQRTFERAIAEIEYLTSAVDFGNVGRGDPVPSELDEEQRRTVGLHPDTWFLEVVADPDGGAKIERPLTKETNSALDWSALMKLAETKAVRVSQGDDLQQHQCAAGHGAVGGRAAARRYHARTTQRERAPSLTTMVITMTSRSRCFAAHWR